MFIGKTQEKENAANKGKNQQQNEVTEKTEWAGQSTGGGETLMKGHFLLYTGRE